jgi:hypothetical protein
LDYFTANLWLASPDTRQFHGEILKLINSVDYQLTIGYIHEREADDLAKHLRERMAPFYAHLEAKLDQLQRRLIPKAQD